MATEILHERLLRVEEFAERLGIKPSTARSWVLSRRVAKIKIGRRSVRIPESEIARIVADGYVPARKESR